MSIWYTIRSVTTTSCYEVWPTLVATSIVPIIRIGAYMCILVLEFKADIWSASQRSSLMRSSSSCLALLICSLVALSCFSRRDGPFPHFPVPSMKHFKLDIVSELRPIKGGNEFLLGFRPRFRLSNMVVFGRFSQKLVKKMWVISDPRHSRRFDSLAIFGLPLVPLSSSAPTPPRRCWAAGPYSHWHAQFLFRFGHRFVIINFVVTFKKRCLYSFIGICGTWMHRFAFWKFYLKPGLITSFRSALRSVRMDVRKHWSLSGLITFSMLAESLRSFDLSRKIKGDSVRRVIVQILGSYLLSCTGFSVYEVVRVTCLSQSLFIYISPAA